MNYREEVTGGKLIKYFIPIYGIILYYLHLIRYSIIIKEPIGISILLLGGFEIGWTLSHLFLLIYK